MFCFSIILVLGFWTWVVSLNLIHYVESNFHMTTLFRVSVQCNHRVVPQMTSIRHKRQGAWPVQCWDGGSSGSLHAQARLMGRPAGMQAEDRWDGFERISWTSRSGR